MQVTILPCSVSGQPLQLFTTYLINGTVAVDAGSVGLNGTLAEQARVKHILLTHSHLDHIGSLGPFLDAVYDGSGDCVVIHGLPHTLDALKTDIFNNRIYPDFLKISTFRPPYLKLNELTSGVAIEVGGLRVTPVEVNHVVPTVGFVIDDGQSAVVFPSDTGPTDAIWEVAKKCANLKAVFLECTFPENMAWLADLAKHLTPSLYAGEMQKLGRDVRYITVHMHPRHRDTVIGELKALGKPNVEIGKFGEVYTL